MHKNTVLVIIVLAVVAALLVGINVGKRLNPTSTIIPSPAPVVFIPSPEPTPPPTELSYTLADCGLSFAYMSDFQLAEGSQSAQLTHPNIQTATEEQISIVCAPEIPRPPLTKDKIEVATISGIRVNLYHDASAKDGAPLDAVIFTHPKNGLDVAVLGFGEAFNRLLQTVKLLP